MLRFARVSHRSKPSPSRLVAGVTPIALTLVVAGASAVAACGFDGHATGETGSAVPAPTSQSSPDASGSDPSRDGGPGPVDGGGDTSPPVPTCKDPALSFDGVDDGATVPDDSALDLKNDFTVEAWIKPSAKAAAAEEMDVVSHHDASTSKGWSLIVKAGRIEIVVYGNEGLGTKGYSAGNAGPAYVVAGKWAHIAGTLSGSTLRVYYDGLLRDTQEIGIFFGRVSYVGALRLGRAAASTEFPYQGELDDVRLSSEARYTTAAATKPTALLPADPATIASWHFDEPSGSLLTDAASKGHDGAIAPDTTAPTRVSAPCINAR